MNFRQNNQRIDYLLSTLWSHRYWWLAPTLVGLVLTSAYVLFFRAESWTARQSFIVRDDLLGQSFKLGRFESQESMKSAQETILEISRRPMVIRKSLEKLGPPSGSAETDWITDELIEDTQGAISFTAPNGAEFGRTEVIVLTAKASSRARAKKFTEHLSTEIVAKVNEVRMRRLQSMEAELIEARDGAVRQQKDAIEELKKLDLLLGADVGVMNALNDSQAGDTPMKREILQIRAESRGLKRDLEADETVHRALLKVYANPQKVVDLPSGVLKQQTALNRLKDVLLEKQSILHSEEAANFPAHPAAKRARLAVESMERQIFNTIKSEIKGVEARIKMRQGQLARLDQEVDALDQRLVTLSAKRADHLRLTSEVKQLTEIANSAQATLSEVQSMANAVRGADLITPVDGPQVGTRPDGLGRKIVAAAGGLGGLIIGLGLVLLVAPPMEPSPDQPTRTPRSSSSAATSSNDQSATQRQSAASNAGSPIQVGHPSLTAPASAIESAAVAMKAAATAMQSAASIPRTNSLSQSIEQSMVKTNVSTQHPSSANSSQSSATRADKNSPRDSGFETDVEGTADRSAKNKFETVATKQNTTASPKAQPIADPASTQSASTMQSASTIAVPAVNERPNPVPVPASSSPASPASSTQPVDPTSAANPVELVDAAFNESFAKRLSQTVAESEKHAAIHGSDSLASQELEAAESTPVREERKPAASEVKPVQSNPLESTAAKAIAAAIEAQRQTKSKPPSHETPRAIATPTEPVVPNQTSTPPLGVGNAEAQPQQSKQPTQEISAKRPSARPVDLVKSAEQETSFARHESEKPSLSPKPAPPTNSTPSTKDNRRAAAATVPIQLPEQAPVHQEAKPKSQLETGPQRTNPFLKDRVNETASKATDSKTEPSQPGPRSSAPTVVEAPLTFADLRKAPTLPAGDNRGSAGGNPPAGVGGQERRVVAPLPEEIRKLTESISRFSQPRRNPNE